MLEEHRAWDTPGFSPYAPTITQVRGCAPLHIAAVSWRTLDLVGPPGKEYYALVFPTFELESTMRSRATFPQSPR